jgi:ATP-dependent Zn protease
MIDEEVLGIINAEYEKCHSLLTERKADIER